MKTCPRLSMEPGAWFVDENSDDSLRRQLFPRRYRWNPNLYLLTDETLKNPQEFKALLLLTSALGQSDWVLLARTQCGVSSPRPVAPRSIVTGETAMESHRIPCSSKDTDDDLDASNARNKFHWRRTVILAFMGYTVPPKWLWNNAEYDQTLDSGLPHYQTNAHSDK